MVDTLEVSNINIWREKKENGAATMFKEIMDGNVPELMKDINSHIQETCMQSKLHMNTW